MPSYKQDMTATSGNMGGDKKKKRKDKRESAKQERKNLLTENPVVNRSDDNENIGRGGKGPKPMSKVRRAKASLMKVKDGLVSRFQGSTPKIGKNERLEQMVESLKPSIVKMGPAMVNIPPPPPMPKGLTQEIKPVKAIKKHYEKGSGTISSHTKTTVPVKKK